MFGRRGRAPSRKGNVRGRNITPSKPRKELQTHEGDADALLLGVSKTEVLTPVTEGAVEVPERATEAGLEAPPLGDVEVVFVMPDWVDLVGGLISEEEPVPPLPTQDVSVPD
jgi:hypothetical protein